MGQVQAAELEQARGLGPQERSMASSDNIPPGDGMARQDTTRRGRGSEGAPLGLKQGP